MSWIESRRPTHLVRLFFVQFSKVYVTSQQLLYHNKLSFECQELFLKKFFKLFCLVVVVCCDNFYILSSHLLFVNNFFVVFSNFFREIWNQELLFNYWFLNRSAVWLALRHVIIYQDFKHWSIIIFTFFKLFFNTDYYDWYRYFRSFFTPFHPFLAIVY